MAGRSIQTKGIATPPGYRLSTVTAAYRTGLTAQDTADLTHADIKALAEIDCGGYPTVSVTCHHSVSGATVGIVFVRFYKAANGDLTPKSMSSATLTAGTRFTAPTKYPSVDGVAFDTEGCAMAKVLIATAPSSGNVDIWAEVH